MALTETENLRIQAIEQALNNVQTALNNVATRRQLVSLQSIRQGELDQLRLDLEHLGETGITPGLTAHKTDPDAHIELNDRYYTQSQTNNLLDELETEFQLLSNDLLTLSGNFVTLQDSVNFLFEDPVEFGNTNIDGVLTVSGEDIPTRSFHKDGIIIYVDPNTGSDFNDGSQLTPIKTLAELERRLPLVSHDCRAILASGIYQYPNFGDFGVNNTALNKAKGLTFGLANGSLYMEGTLAVVATVDVSSTSWPHINLSSSTLTVDAHVGDIILTTSATGIVQRKRIISNKGDRITLCCSQTFVMPPTGTLNIYRSVTTITPPSATSTTAANKIFFSGNARIFDITFSGNGVGPTDHHAGKAVTFVGCTFKDVTAATGVGCTGGGYDTFTGCFWDNNSFAGISVGSGFVTITSPVFRNCPIGIYAFGAGAVAHLSANDSAAFISCSTAAMEAKTGGLINDETRNHFIGNVTDLVTLHRGAKYQKVNWSLQKFPTGQSPTRNAVRCVAGGNYADLIDSTLTDFVTSGAYVHLSDGTDVTLANFQTSGFAFSQSRGDWVVDGHDA